MKKGRLTRAGGDLARKINFMIHNPQKLVHMQRRALAAESDYIRKIASSQSSSSLSFSADTHEKGRSLFSFSLIGHIQLLIPLPPCLVLFAQTKDAKIVCIIAVGPDFSTHNLKRLASARHLIERENCTLTRLHASNRPVSEDEKADDVSSRRRLYCGTPVVTSWAVAGQQVVFLNMYLQTRVTLRRSP